MRHRIASALFAAALVFGVCAVAYAHATLVSAEPPAGAVLAASPSRVRLLFSEELDVSLALISLTGPDGRATKLAVGGDPHDVHALIAPVGTLSSGSYRINWHVVSDDGHPVDGSYLFSVGAISAAPPTAPAENALAAQAAWGPTIAGAPLVPAATRAIAIGSLMALAGLVFFMSLTHDARIAAMNDPGRAAKWLSITAAIFGPLNLLVGAVNAAPDHHVSAGTAYATLAAAMSSHVAAGLRAQVTTTLLGLWSLWIYRRIPVATVFFVAAVIISGGIGHAAAIDPIVNVPAKAIHLVACAAWIGGVLWLVTRDRTDVTLFARESARVSTVALAAAIAVLVTGAAQTLIMLASPPDLVRTGYGVLILTKFLGFMVLIAFGWHHRFHALPRLATTGSSAAGFRISLRRELIVMAAVIGLGALLAYTPAPAPAAAPGTTSIPSSPTHEHNP